MLVRPLLRKLEALGALDPIAKKLSGFVGKATSPTPVKNALTGRWLGHPVHPLLTDIPIGAWTAAAVLDLLGPRGSQKSADSLVAVGLVAAVPTVATGAADWADYSDDRVHRVGVVHATSNTVAAVCYLASLVARRRGKRARGLALSYAGLGAVAVGGYLGGHLAYGLASGMDRTTFVEGPADWVEVIEESALSDGEPHRVHAGGVGIVMVRRDGVLHALAETCSHMGGPLHQGDVVDGCIRCPWHGSTFALSDGSVRRGPASAPQPLYETRVQAGRVSVRAAHRPKEA